jgi:methylmalonyl-CoA epimerase
MKAVLDHVGIAVRDLSAALAFYRDAIGLEVEASEEVVSQDVRAHVVPVGEASVELIEASAPGSPISRFVDRRGPGLHHITLRVDDLAAALGQLKARGVRLIDEQPRPGAEGALVAFIHPSSAHGVLVELKQPGHQPPATSHVSSVQKHAVGNLELVSVCDGFFYLDGGAMFGVVPKPLWSAKAPADGRNRVRLALRSLVVRGAQTMIIDAGLGDKEDEKFLDLYGVERGRHLDHALAEAGLAVEDIDIVLATHLHFDHAGGFTRRDRSGGVRPRFPRARYVVRRGEWEDATHPNERSRASYLPRNYVPLAEAGVLQLIDEDQTIMPGVRVRRTGGHTMHHQMVLIESDGQAAAFVGDLVPTTAHLRAPWIMGYDLYPIDTLASKKAFLREAIERQMLVFFQHDPAVPAGHIREQNGKPIVVVGG